MKRQLTMFQVLGQSTKSGSGATKRQCNNVATSSDEATDHVHDRDDSSQANDFERLNDQPDQVLEQGSMHERVGICSDEKGEEESDTEVSIVAKSTISSRSQASTQSAASSEASRFGCFNVVIEDIAISPTGTPVQPRYINFPTTVISGKQRSFSPRWYTAYNWLEYSVKNDAMFCYPCRMLACGQGKAEKAFSELGY